MYQISLLMFLLIFHCSAIARNIETTIEIEHVTNTNLVTVSIKVKATSGEHFNDTHINVVGGYTLECPVSPVEKYDHLQTAIGAASAGNQLEFAILPLGHASDGESYVSGYPMTRSWQQVLGSVYLCR